MKKYLVEFTLANGEKEVVEFTTDRLQWTVDQWCRNRRVIKHEILEEGVGTNKQMLFG
jgi:hypothetical protein